MKRIALIVNPVAGIGGPLSLKGSDGVSWGEIGVYMGPSFKTSIIFAREIKKALFKARESFELLAPRGLMGEISAREIGIDPRIICRPKYPSKAEDTKICSQSAYREKADLIVFVGGDGTAWDIYDGANGEIPIFGVPGGTKIYSSIFAKSINAATRLFLSFVNDSYYIAEGEIIVVDEDKLRRSGQFSIVRSALAKTIESREETLHQHSKDPYASREDEIEELAECIAEEIDNSIPLIIGPGRTAGAIAEKLKIRRKDILSVSAGWKGKTYCDDCSSQDLLRFLEEIKDPEMLRIIVSPLGSSGFLLGRGNQQIPLALLRIVSLNNFIIVSTRSKAMRLKNLLVDLKDNRLEQKFSNYVRVRTGCNEETIMKIIPA
ncbi:MAG: NAD(+)/NADH kinase [Fervidicoccaceae archaeon]